MSDREMDDLTRLLREEYNPPPPAPREEMWAVIQAGLRSQGAPPVSLEDARLRRTPRPWRQLGWAAAAVLGLGVSIGRVTAPTGPTVAEAPVEGGAAATLMRLAAAEHLGRTEDLLRMVRSDGREGRLDPALGVWARGLLTQTRLLLDSTEGGDPTMRELLEDLELVLVQVAAVAHGGEDGERTRSELSLALEGIEQREVLPRIEAVLPTVTPLAGT